MPVIKGQSLSEILAERGVRRPFVQLLMAASAAFVLFAVLFALKADIKAQTERIVLNGSSPKSVVSFESDGRLLPIKSNSQGVLAAYRLPDDLPKEVMTIRDGGPVASGSEPVGAPVAQIALQMESLRRQMKRSRKGFLVRSEGRFSAYKGVTGWLVRYQFMQDGQLMFGLRALLCEDLQNPVYNLVDVQVEGPKSPMTPNVQALGKSGPVRPPFFSMTPGAEALVVE